MNFHQMIKSGMCHQYMTTWRGLEVGLHGGSSLYIIMINDGWTYLQLTR